MEDNHQRPYGLLPNLSQFPSAATTTLPYPPLPHYYPNLLLHPPSIYSEPSSGNPFVVSSDTGTTATAAPTYGQERESNIIGGGGGGSSRWPRQETLTLLEIRSRLANKFREANQKAPLWDEVSRIMSEEHSYQRSGKKCREKFENLYKYYKKTKEGKAGRQDGKNYRFFRQIEAIYGESSSHSSRDHFDVVNPQQYSPSFSNSMSVECLQFDTSSEGEDDVGGGDKGDLSAIALAMAENKKMRRKGWKEKVKKFVDVQLMRLVEKQDEWMDKMISALESKERERARREIEWREQESARFERERAIWAKERSWMEARDATFVTAMRKLSGKESDNNGSVERVEEDLDEAWNSGDIRVRRKPHVPVTDSGN